MIEQDVLIIGSGVAGMSAAQYAARAGRSVTMLESIAPGGQTMYIDMIENYPGFDQPISGYEIGMKFHAQAEAFGAKLVYATVTKLSKERHLPCRNRRRGNLSGKGCYFCTGRSTATWESRARRSTTARESVTAAPVTDLFFKGKKILVVGGGDTRSPMPLLPLKLSEHITIVHRKERFRGQDNLVAQVSMNKNIELVMQHTASLIKGDGNKVTLGRPQGSCQRCEYEREFDAGIHLRRHASQTEMLDKSVLDESGYVSPTKGWKRSWPACTLPEMYALRCSRQLVTAASDGAIAAHCASEYIDELEGRAYR